MPQKFDPLDPEYMTIVQAVAEYALALPPDARSLLFTSLERSIGDLMAAHRDAVDPGPAVQ